MSYETVVAAIGGDPVAAEDVLAYFDGYIDRLCTHAYVDDAGHMSYGLDIDRKTQLQGKLLRAILRFTI